MGYKKHKQYRLPGYDYSSNGNYFVTICTKNKDAFLGKVINDKMKLSPIGKITESTWKQIPEKFPNIILGALQVMPDHFQAIITIKNTNTSGNLFNCRNLINQIPANTNQIPTDINQIPTHTQQIPTENNIQMFESGIQNDPMELKTISL